MAATLPPSTPPHALGRRGRLAPLAICKFWKLGRCDRFPCKFLHTDAAAPPPGNVWIHPDVVAPVRKPAGETAVAEEEATKPAVFPRAIHAEARHLSLSPTKPAGEAPPDPLSPPPVNPAEEAQPEPPSRTVKWQSAPPVERRCKAEEAPPEPPSRPAKGQSAPPLERRCKAEEAPPEPLSRPGKGQSAPPLERHSNAEEAPLKRSKRSKRRRGGKEGALEPEAPPDPLQSTHEPPSLPFSLKPAEETGEEAPPEPLRSVRSAPLPSLKRCCKAAEETAPVKPTKRRRRSKASKSASGGAAAAAWCVGDNMRGMARLEGHTKEVTGVALPEGSDKLFSGSLDCTVRVWDCNTGKCVLVVPMAEGEIGTVISTGPLVLIGLRGVVCAQHTGTGVFSHLPVPVAAGQVRALLSEGDGHIFAGTDDGSIYMWRMDGEHSHFSVVATLTGHETAVVSLGQGSIGLFSGSMDGNIRVWDIETQCCIHSFAGHRSMVTSLCCWEHHLISSGHDGAVKVWTRKPGQDELELELYYAYQEGEPVVAISGTRDADLNPVLLVSRRDGCVRVVDLPSLKERGRIQCKGEPKGLCLRRNPYILTGDTAGMVTVAVWTSCCAPQDGTDT